MLLLKTSIAALQAPALGDGREIAIRRKHVFGPTMASMASGAAVGKQDRYRRDVIGQMKIDHSICNCSTSARMRSNRLQDMQRTDSRGKPAMSPLSPQAGQVK